MKEIIKDLQKELKIINQNVQITFDNPESIRQQIKQLKNTHKRLYQIKEDINSELKKLNFTKFINQVGVASSRGVEIAKGVAKTALGFKLRMAEIAIPILSDVTSTIGDELLESGVEDIFNSKSDKDVSKSKDKEIYLLFNLQQFTDKLIIHIDEINRIIDPSKLKIAKDKIVDLHEDFRLIFPLIRLDFDWVNSQKMKQQVENIRETKNKLDKLQKDIKEVIELVDNHKDKSLQSNKKYILNSRILEGLLSKLQGFICGIKLNSEGEIILLTYNKKTITLAKLVCDYEALNKKVESLKLQTDHFNEFIKNHLSNNFSTIKQSLQKKNIDIKSVQYRIEEITKIIRLNFKVIKSKLIKQHIEQISNAKQALILIKQEIDAVTQTLEEYNTGFDIKSSGIEKFISIFGKSIIGLEFQASGEVILNFTSKKDKVADIHFEYFNVSKSIDSLIQEANQTILSANKRLKNKRILETTILATALCIGIGIWVTATKPPQLQQLIAYLSIVKDSVQRGASLKIEEISKYNGKQEKEIILPDLKHTKQLKDAQKLAMEASFIAQKPPHPIEVWQQAKPKWQKAINILESIPQNSGIYPQAKDKLVLYRNNYKAINKTILIEQKALEDFEAAKRKAWQAAVIVQNPSQSIALWQQAQSNLSQAINLLNSIPKSSFIFSKAKEKVIYYRNNYNVISSKIDKATLK